MNPPFAPTPIKIMHSRTIRVIAIAGIALGLVFVASSASARFAVASLLNRALAVACGPAKPKTAPRKRSAGSVLPASLSKLPLSSLATIQQTGEARVATDKLAYQPGDTVFITGAGFSPNERVTLQIRHHDLRVE